MDFLIPDVVGDPLEGWRTWLVVPRNRTSGELVLRSFVYSEIWEPQEVHEAKCRVTARDVQAHHEDGVPEPKCKCGIYAAHDIEVVNKYYHEGGYNAGTWKEIYRVRGCVAMWGKVIEGETGLRSQYAYPSRIEVPERIIGRESLLSVSEIVLALEKYGVPMEVTDEHLDLRVR